MKWRPPKAPPTIKSLAISFLTKLNLFHTINSQAGEQDCTWFLFAFLTCLVLCLTHSRGSINICGLIERSYNKCHCSGGFLSTSREDWCENKIIKSLASNVNVVRSNLCLKKRLALTFDIAWECFQMKCIMDKNPWHNQEDAGYVKLALPIHSFLDGKAMLLENKAILFQKPRLNNHKT